MAGQWKWHVRDSFREVDAGTWLIGGKLLMSRSSTKTTSSLWTDDDDLHYSVFEIPETTEIKSRALDSPSELPFPLVYDVGDAHAVWKVGNVFVKICNDDHVSRGSTLEHVTLAAVKAMCPSFPIPEVVYHGEWGNRRYLITSAVPGKTLFQAWPDLDEQTRWSYADRVVEICEELAQHQADYIGSVNKGNCSDRLLAGTGNDMTHEALLRRFLGFGMDCSTFVFAHGDMGPGNLIVCPDGSLGVIDWEGAGFVPKDWIRSKFGIGSGLDLDYSWGKDGEDYMATARRRAEYRRRVHIALGKKGYNDFSEVWMEDFVARNHIAME